MKKLCLYFKEIESNDRWLPGDRYLRDGIKKIIGKKTRISSLQKVFNNLCLGFDKINIKYCINKPFKHLTDDDIVIVLGREKKCLAGYNKKNPIIAGIGLMTHPTQWSNIFDDYPIKVYLQHSKWTLNIYEKYFKNCAIWFAGIDTEEWAPSMIINKENDILIYNKIMWPNNEVANNLLGSIESYIINNGLSYKIITYGSYNTNEFKDKLNSSRAMIFLCEHESQGLAYQEALAMNVPIIAWQQGKWLDPNLKEYGEINEVMADSVPYFDDTCGKTFKNFIEFESKFPNFYHGVLTKNYNPRKYILKHLTLEKSAERMLEIVDHYISE